MANHNHNNNGMLSYMALKHQQHVDRQEQDHRFVQKQSRVECVVSKWYQSVSMVVAVASIAFAIFTLVELYIQHRSQTQKISRGAVAGAIAVIVGNVASVAFSAYEMSTG